MDRSYFFVGLTKKHRKAERGARISLLIQAAPAEGTKVNLNNLGSREVSSGDWHQSSVPSHQKDYIP